MSASDPYPVLRLLQAHLEGRLRQGASRLWLKPEATKALREIVKMNPRPHPRPLVAEPGPDLQPPVTDLGPSRVPGPAISVPQGGATVTGTPERRGEEPALPVAVTPAGVPLQHALPEAVPAAPSLADREARLAEIRGRALEGREAKALGTLRDRMVFAAGSPMAKIVLVGEAPGAEEERQGEPFVGPAGQLLTRVLKVMGLERSQVYITNICKYRPAMENQGSGNRPPSPLEMASCLGFVREEIAVIRPRVIVALGGTAITGLLGLKTGVMNARGKFYEFEGIPVMATLHPSYLLRKEQEGPQVANAEKRKLWEDMLMVMERAGMPVTDKQRAFFLPK